MDKKTFDSAFGQSFATALKSSYVAGGHPSDEMIQASWAAMRRKLEARRESFDQATKETNV